MFNMGIFYFIKMCVEITMKYLSTLFESELAIAEDIILLKLSLVF
jgi:hypothetical protein